MPLRVGTELPELTGATEWIGSEVTREELLGTPVLVHFWSVSCYICKDNMPTLKKWKEQYGSQLKFVAIHMPRAEGELDTAWVKRIIAEQGIDESCAIDNEHNIGDTFQTGGLWPSYFLFDAEGKLRSRAAGDAGLRNLEATLTRVMDAPVLAAV